MTTSNEALLTLITSMAHSPTHNYVVPGLTSELIGGEGHGTVRFFTSDRRTREWITPHSHRFNFCCIVLEGMVENILFVPGKKDSIGDRYSLGTLKRIGEGMGSYEITRSDTSGAYEEVLNRYNPGDGYSMKAEEIHSIRFGRGTKVLFIEGPQIKDTSVFLEPFSNGQTVQTFEVRPWMFNRSMDKV